LSEKCKERKVVWIKANIVKDEENEEKCNIVKYCEKMQNYWILNQL